MLKHILLLSCMFLCVVILAKILPKVSGTVKDANGEPAQFANVILMHAKDSAIVKGAYSSESGNFSFENVEPGEYLVLVSQTGHKFYTKPFAVKEGESETNVGTISLPQNAVNLNEVNVSAYKPFIEHRIDQTIVNVENSIIDAGGTALEVLQRSPGITIDNEGNIRMTGKQGVMVMMDGKPTYLSPKDLYELLRNTSADQVSQIIIITNPSAKYDAAGNAGIINIKMKKKQNLGLNGSYRVSYGQGVYPDFGTGLQLNYRNEKLNLFGGYDFMRAFYFERVTNIRRFSEPGYTSEFEQRTFDKGGFFSNNFRAGLDYFATKKSTLGFLVRGNLFNNHDETRATTLIKNGSENVDSSYVTENINDSKWNTVSGNVNYVYKIDTLGSELSADVDYAHYSNASDFTFETKHYSGDNIGTRREYATDNQPAKINIRSFKTDYVKQFQNKMKLEAGGKISFVTTNNDVQYFNYINDAPVPDTGKTNHFDYTEHINAAYINWSADFKKFGMQLGLRGEQTLADGEQEIHNASFHHSYFDLFPSAFFSYTYSDKHQTRLSYTRRIDRPGYQQLNPFRYFIDPYNFEEGNPNLTPQFTHNFELTHVIMKLYSIGIFYSHTVDAMTQIAKQIDSTHTTFVTTENLDNNDNYGVRASIPLQPAKWWENNINMEAYSNQYSGISSVGAVDKRITSFELNVYNRFSLPHGWRVELGGWYRSSALYGTTLSDPKGSVWMGFGKRFKEKFQLRIQVNDIFHTDITTSIIQYQNINVDFKRVYDSQFVRIHLAYSFGNKSVARARQRSTGAEDEQNRINTNR